MPEGRVLPKNSPLDQKRTNEKDDLMGKEGEKKRRLENDRGEKKGNFQTKKRTGLRREEVKGKKRGGTPDGKGGRRSEPRKEGGGETVLIQKITTPKQLEEEKELCGEKTPMNGRRQYRTGEGAPFVKGVALGKRWMWRRPIKRHQKGVWRRNPKTRKPIKEATALEKKKPGGGGESVFLRIVREGGGGVVEKDYNG